VEVQIAQRQGAMFRGKDMTDDSSAELCKKVSAKTRSAISF